MVFKQLFIQSVFHITLFISGIFSVNASTLAEQLMIMSQKQLHAEGQSNSELSGSISDPKLNYVTVDITELQDNDGLKYLGGKVKVSDVEKYLLAMETILKGKYQQFRDAQIKRDHNQLHVTLINPYEYKELSKQDVSKVLNKTLAFKLFGLGRVAKDNKKTFFVVASSEEAKKVRVALKLKQKDFHITLGFYPQDIYGVRKNQSTLVNR